MTILGIRLRASNAAHLSIIYETNSCELLSAIHFMLKSLSVNKFQRTFVTGKQRQNKNMAKPIAPTPVLRGQSALDFMVKISENRKASLEETTRVNTGADRIQSMMKS